MVVVGKEEREREKGKRVEGRRRSAGMALYVSGGITAVERDPEATVLRGSQHDSNVVQTVRITRTHQEILEQTEMKGKLNVLLSCEGGCERERQRDKMPMISTPQE